MKSYLKTFVPFLLAVLIGSLTFAFGQTKNDFPMRGGRDFGAPPHGLNPRLLEQLDLTDAQKEQIGNLHEKSRADSQTHFDKIKVVQGQLKDAVEEGNFDESLVRQIIAQKMQAMTELEIIRLRTDAAIYKLLTAEQKGQLEQLKQRRPEFPRGEKPNMSPLLQN
ncbi:MAG: Spy/CpxP family protein refolding chaperone [Acidobacteriota bacterium]|nr:Spy/CpxP family protein refolding chaperone [Acidobacteriota bacterium]